MQCMRDTLSENLARNNKKYSNPVNFHFLPITCVKLLGWCMPMFLLNKAERNLALGSSQRLFHDSVASFACFCLVIFWPPACLAIMLDLPLFLMRRLTLLTSEKSKCWAVLDGWEFTSIFLIHLLAYISKLALAEHVSRSLWVQASSAFLIHLLMYL